MNNQLDSNMDTTSRLEGGGSGDASQSIRPVIARPITQTQIDVMRAGKYFFVV